MPTQWDTLGGGGSGGTKGSAEVKGDVEREEQEQEQAQEQEDCQGHLIADAAGALMEGLGSERRRSRSRREIWLVSPKLDEACSDRSENECEMGTATDNCQLQMHEMRRWTALRVKTAVPSFVSFVGSPLSWSAARPPWTSSSSKEVRTREGR